MDKNSIDVSVIIPTYKPGTYIEECIRMLGKQTYSFDRFEIIIVLNGCKEPWFSMIQMHAKKYLHRHNVRIIHTETPGVSNARNLGLDIARGVYVTFIDDDDYISEGYIEHLYQGITPELIKLSDSRCFDDVTEKVLPNYALHDCFLKHKNDTSISVIKVRSLFSGPCMKLIHKDIIGKIRFDVSLSIGEDSLFMFEISKNFKQIRFASEEAIYFRRIREGSALTQKRTNIYHIANFGKCVKKYSAIFWSSPLKYNFGYYIILIFGSIKCLIKRIA